MQRLNNRGTPASNVRPSGRAARIQPGTTASPRGDTGRRRGGVTRPNGSRSFGNASSATQPARTGSRTLTPVPTGAKNGIRNVAPRSNSLEALARQRQSSRRTRLTGLRNRTSGAGNRGNAFQPNPAAGGGRTAPGSAGNRTSGAGNRTSGAGIRGNVFQPNPAIGAGRAGGGSGSTVRRMRGNMFQPNPAVATSTRVRAGSNSGGGRALRGNAFQRNPAVGVNTRIGTTSVRYRRGAHHDRLHHRVHARRSHLHHHGYLHHTPYFNWYFWWGNRYPDYAVVEPYPIVEYYEPYAPFGPPEEDYLEEYIPAAPLEGEPAPPPAPDEEELVEPEEPGLHPDFEAGLDDFLVGKFDDARKRFNKVLADEPENGEAWLAWLHIGFALGRFGDAANGLAHAAELGAFPRGYRFDPAPLYPDVKAFEKAFDLLEQRIKDDPRDMEARLVMTYFQLSAGDKVAAYANIERILLVRPKDPTAPILAMALLPPEDVAAPAGK